MNQSNTSKKNDALSKSDIVSLIAEGMTLSKVDIDHVVDKLFSVMANEMAQKKDIRIYGFGVFSAQERAERSAFNPKTREKIVVPAQWVPKFRAMSALKSAINGQKTISE